VFRAINGVMAALFLFAVAVQYNDPDPIRWMAIYAAACALSITAAARGRAPRWLSAVVCIVALAWGIEWALGISSVGLYAHMFDAWEMKSVPIEEAREASGLFIVATWMAILAVFPRA
jgi:hypothetical protein